MSSYPFSPNGGISTNALAEQLSLKPESIRVRLCNTGSYFGVVPKKLPNNRLIWPSNSYQLLVEERTSGGLLSQDVTEGAIDE